MKEVAEKTLQQEPCKYAISKKAVLYKIKEVCFSSKWSQFRSDYGSNGQRDFLINYIEQLPPVTPQPKTGHWIHHKEKEFVCAEHWECSQCHRTTMTYPFIVNGIVNDNDYNAMYYCPKCGAKMVEPQEGEINE